MRKTFSELHRKMREPRGFTLLLAALVASIALALGTSIFQIAQKQVILSSTGRESQFAFYAADTAAECALFWDSRADIHTNTFATSSASTPAANVSCDNQTVAVTVAQSSATAATSTFTVSLFTDVSAGYCVDVTVAKWKDVGTGAIHTNIGANGYNTTCATITTSPTALQRSVELQY